MHEPVTLFWHTLYIRQKGDKTIHRQQEFIFSISLRSICLDRGSRLALILLLLLLLLLPSAGYLFLLPNTSYMQTTDILLLLLSLLLYTCCEAYSSKGKVITIVCYSPAITCRPSPSEYHHFPEYRYDIVWSGRWISYIISVPKCNSNNRKYSPYYIRRSIQSML